MKVTRSRICLAALVCAIAFAILPLNAAEEKPKDEQVVAMVYSIGGLPVWSPRIGDDGPRFSPELLIAHIKLAVEPDSWEKENRSITPHETTKSLVIRQTRANHDQISKLIDRFLPRYSIEELRKIDPDGVVLGINENGNVVTTPVTPANEQR